MEVFISAVHASCTFQTLFLINLQKAHDPSVYTYSHSSSEEVETNQLTHG